MTTMKTFFSGLLWGRARRPSRAWVVASNNTLHGRDTTPCLSRRILAFFNLACLLCLPTNLFAQLTTYSQQVDADTFVSSGQPNMNFGSLAAMEIAAPTLAQPRAEKTLLRFNTGAMRAAFDADYGPGNWTVTGVTLSLFSNVATGGVQPNNGSFNRIASGDFEFDLIGNDNWDQSSITWNTLSDILPGPGNNNTLTSLGTFFWSATGQTASLWTLNANSELASQIYSGDPISILGQSTANSTVGYLFNTVNLNPAFLNVTVTAVPEPSRLSLPGALILVLLRRARSVRRK